MPASRPRIVRRRDPQVAATDRLDTCSHARLVELDEREHVAFIGQGQRRHLRAHGSGDQAVDADGRIDQRKLAVQMQVDVAGSHANRAVVPCRLTVGLRSGKVDKRGTSTAVCVPWCALRTTHLDRTTDARARSCADVADRGRAAAVLRGATACRSPCGQQSRSPATLFPWRPSVDHGSLWQ